MDFRVILSPVCGKIKVRAPGVVQSYQKTNMVAQIFGSLVDEALAIIAAVTKKEGSLWKKQSICTNGPNG